MRAGGTLLSRPGSVSSTTNAIRRHLTAARRIRVLWSSADHPTFDFQYHSLVLFAWIPPSKPAYSVHPAFFDGSNPLMVKTYANRPLPLVGAGSFYTACGLNSDISRPWGPKERLCFREPY